jgi:protein-S-isoprenylcysteine O-methyltransferase Ste14
LAIAILAAVVLFTARWQLGTSFSVTPQARELVTHGVYSKIRNPIYFFSAVLVTTVLVALLYRCAFLPLAILVPVQIICAREEWRVLEARFGDEYQSCGKGTWV